MKKVIVSFISIFIIVLAVIIINKLLYPEEEISNNEESTNISYGEYELYNYDQNFNAYTFKDSTGFNTEVQNISLSYEENDLKINDRVFGNIYSIYSYFAIYDDCIVVLGYFDQDAYQHILIYNTYLDDYEKIDKIDNFYIDLSKDIIFENIGLIINTSIIHNNKISNVNICDIKDTTMTVNKTYELYYNLNEKNFDKREELYSSNLFVYLKDNKLC